MGQESEPLSAAAGVMLRKRQITVSSRTESRLCEETVNRRDAVAEPPGTDSRRVSESRHVTLQASSSYSLMLRRCKTGHRGAKPGVTCNRNCLPQGSGSQGPMDGFTPCFGCMTRKAYTAPRPVAVITKINYKILRGTQW